MSGSLPPGLIINADDLGIHPRINAGIVSAYRHGLVTSATMLMTTPYLEETVGLARSATLPIGIHLSLTLGKAVAPAGEVPDLIDEAGNFTWSSRRLLMCSFADHAGRRLAEQVRREFTAQLSLARDHGLELTHADSHQHVHMNPAVFSLVEEILPRYGIKKLRYSREQISLMAIIDLLKQRKYINLAKVTLLRALSLRVRPRLETTDRFFGVLYSGIVTKNALTRAITELPANQSLEVCIHPGFPPHRSVTAYPVASENSFVSSSARRMEHDVLTDTELRETVRERGLILRGFDGLAKDL
jgi:predicted glycoside hydrolase/deacetylase ChbG (UPF0249 family)